MPELRKSWQGLNSTIRLVSVLVVINMLPAMASAQIIKSNGLTVAVPNGYANISVDDMQVRSTAGSVLWTRSWNGQEWKFNSQWESLSQSWTNMTGSQTADTTGSTINAAGTGTSTSTAQFTYNGNSAGSGDSGCWIWVDDDWQPSSSGVINGVPQAAPMIPERTVPFNRVMGQDSTDYAPPLWVNIDYASLCPGAVQSTGVANLQGIRRQNELYLGDNGRYAFSNRAVLEQRAVRAVAPVASDALMTQLTSGSIPLSLVNIDKGYRWMHKEGDWIDYNTQGQVVAYGDKNNNTTWLVRDSNGILRGVVDDHGRTLYTLHYTGALITEVRDYPVGNGMDLPARSVKYQYDSNNRLTQVTDVRGNLIKYDYDAANRITAITDQEGRVDKLSYNGDMVTQRIAPDGGVTDYVFDYDDANKQFYSKITGPQAAAGRKVEEFTHNRVSKLVRQIVNGRTDDEVRYDTAARAEQHTNARGFTTTVTRDEFDQIVEIDQADGTSIKRSYSALNLQLTESTDEAGIKTQYQHDAKGNLIQKIEAAGTPDQRTTNYQVNSLGQITQMTRLGRTEANGTVTPDATWQIEYDASGQISKTTDPEGNVRQYVYNRIGNLVKSIDPLGNATRYELDAAGNLTKVTDALGNSLLYQYDKVDNLVTYTDARGNLAKKTYDAMNHRIQSINPAGGVYKLQYDAQGLPIMQVDEDGHTTQFGYDNFLKLTKQIDGLGNTTNYSYQIADGSATGMLGSLTAPTESQFPTFVQHAKFDQRNRKISQTSTSTDGQELQSKSLAYDSRGYVKSETDAYGKTRLYARDALGEIVESTDNVGNKTQSQYDVRGNLLQIKDAKGNVTQFLYDRNNRILKEILPLGQTTTYAYDAASRLVSRIDPNGNKTIFTYDAANRVIQLKRYNSGNLLQRTTDYTWDASGNLTAWNDTDHSRGQTTSGQIQFDSSNRKTNESINYPNGYTLSYSYAFGLGSKKTQLTWPDGTHIDYSYSGHGELQSVTIPNEGTITVNQFKWKAPTQITLPGGTVQQRGYDGLLNLTDLQIKTPGQQSPLSLQNTYGKLQELKQSSRTDAPNGGSSTLTSTYTYDDEIRLTQSKVDTGGLFGTATESFTLDAVGNRTAHSQISGAWTYDANNRLTQRGTGSNATTYQYDDAGNLLKKTEPGNKITQYSYDVLNRFAEVKDGSGNLIARYGYDAMDRRLWKEQFRDKDGNALTQAKRILYMYADEGLIAEAAQDITLNTDQTVTSVNQPVITTQYGPSPDSEFTTGMLFIKTKNSNGQDMVAYYQNDQLGTPLQATDKAGNVVWSANFNVYGQATLTTPTATTEVPIITSNLRLPGQYYDAETGLHYNWHRYYDPSTGQYISSDPIGTVLYNQVASNHLLSIGSIENMKTLLMLRNKQIQWNHPYLYASSSPQNYIDTQGLDGFAGAGVGAAFHALIFGLNGNCQQVVSLGSGGLRTCTLCTACIRIGPGIYVGGGVVGSGGWVDGDVENLTGFSGGFGGDIGVGASVGGSVGVGIGDKGISSAGIGGGARYGGGAGFSLGFDFCWTEKIWCQKDYCKLPS